MVLSSFRDVCNAGIEDVPLYVVLVVEELYGCPKSVLVDESENSALISIKGMPVVCIVKHDLYGLRVVDIVKRCVGHASRNLQCMR